MCLAVEATIVVIVPRSAGGRKRSEYFPSLSIRRLGTTAETYYTTDRNYFNVMRTVTTSAKATSLYECNIVEHLSTFDVVPL